MQRGPNHNTAGAPKRALLSPRRVESAEQHGMRTAGLAPPVWMGAALALVLALSAACEPASTGSSPGKPESSGKPTSGAPHGDALAGPLPAGPLPDGPLPDGHPAVDAGPAANPTPAPDPALTREVVISGEIVSEMLAELSVSVPKEWVKQTPSSPMRLAQWGVPGPAGPASLTVFRFAGGGGSVADNVERWKMQIHSDPAAPVPEVKQRSAGTLTVSTLDLQGDYLAPEMSKRSGDVDILGARMLVAVVEGSGDALYLKLIGPRDTVTPWLDAWSTALDSLGGANAAAQAPAEPVPSGAAPANPAPADQMPAAP